MRQVVFIAGTAYSGSSMLDMMLGSSDSSFSIGEVRALFNPTKNYHIDPPCGCGDTGCNIWGLIKKSGEKNLYVNLFKQFNSIETIVDSSKDPFWIADQISNLKKNGINSRIVLIWKSPEEFALSRMKRRQLKFWNYAWINYHKLFLSLIENTSWRTVSYRDIAVNPEIKLKQICEFLELPYTSKMLNFWEKKHHMLFANTFAKYHMYDKTDDLYSSSVDNLSTKERHFDNKQIDLQSKHRTIFYETNYNDLLPRSVDRILSRNKIYSEIKTFLESGDVENEKDIKITITANKSFQYSSLRILLQKTKQFIKLKYFIIKNLIKTSKL